MSNKKRIVEMVPYGQAAVITNNRGARLVSTNRKPGNPNGKGGGKRSEIKGWTAASRRRFRAWLLEHTCQDGWEFLNVTLTIPGPPVDPLQAKNIFKLWCDRLDRTHNGGCIWRIEIQKRGQLHWHCLVTIPPVGTNPEQPIFECPDDPTRAQQCTDFYHQDWISCCCPQIRQLKQAWIDVISSLPPSPVSDRYQLSYGCNKQFNAGYIGFGLQNIYIGKEEYLKLILNTQITKRC